jgi:polysaccharide biosynthesis/export protein
MGLCTYRMFLATVAVVLSVPLSGSAQQVPPAASAQSVSVSVSTPPAAAPMAVPGPAHALHISSGDLLEIAVFDTPELSGKLRVDAAGDIVLPIAGAVRVSGLTAEAAAVAIEVKLRSAEIMNYPHVSVFVGEYATQGVVVTGEVKSPGIYPLLGSHGLVDVLAAAGGVSSSAGRMVSVTHKSDQEHPEMIKLDSRPGHVIANVDIQPGDTVVVSRAGVAYVVGDVAKSGGFLIEGNDRLTVLEVMALAGGTTRTSAKDKARLIRKTPNGREEMPIPLKAMMEGKVMDMPVEDGDILFIPSSRGKNALYRGTDSAVAIATGLALGKL